MVVFEKSIEIKTSKPIELIGITYKVKVSQSPKKNY
jgi:hypothetical protein